MAIIPQKQLFRWNEVEELGDLERLKLVIDYLPDEELMQALEDERGNGRNDYPVRVVWNSMLAGIVFQHKTTESLRRELMRNGQLRQICGFDITLGVEGVPSASAYTRFLCNLMKHEKEVDGIFNSLVRMLCDELPGFGEVLAIDGKALESYARPRRAESEKPYDGRRDIDANFGVKTYKGRNKDGSVWEKTMSWFGYKLHLIVDAVYELPVAFRVTQASRSEIKEARTLVDEMALRLPEIVDRCMYLTGDKGYDDTKMTTKLWDEYRIKPVIDIRNAWRDGEETKLVTGRENVVYDYKGTVYCYSPEDYRRCEMVPGGFEKDRDALKHLCPAKYYGVECRGKDACPVKSGVRIPLHEDRRVFTPVARPSAKWKKIYDKRTAVERVNSRIDRVFGFEDHCIRGLRKMNLRCSLALVTMLAMALGRIRTKQEHKLRSLVQAA
ncbi:MAG: transposase [Bacillota bacterium]|jgi:hypothetical protein